MVVVDSTIPWPGVCMSILSPETHRKALESELNSQARSPSMMVMEDKVTTKGANGKLPSFHSTCILSYREEAELLKGRMLGSRIPDIFKEIPDIFDLGQLYFEILIDSQKINDLSILMDSM